MMREELQRTFNEYFEQFEKTEEVNTKLKRLVLENIGLQDELFPILEQFQAIAKKTKLYLFNSIRLCDVVLSLLYKRFR